MTHKEALIGTVLAAAADMRKGLSSDVIARCEALADANVYLGEPDSVLNDDNAVIAAALDFIETL